MTEEAKAWVRKAEADLRMAKNEIDRGAREERTPVRMRSCSQQSPLKKPRPG